MDPRIARFYWSMQRIRRTEQVIAEIYSSDKIKSPVHLSIGQEAVAVAACEAMEPGDYVANSYRGHATYLAKGGDLPAMWMELYGKKGGCADGKAGSMHLVDIANGVIGTTAVVATMIPIAAGYAEALKMQKRPQVVVCFMGDGATEEGCFQETLNYASLKKLPILFLCENNRLAIHTPLEKRWATERLCERVETFGIPATKTTDRDVLALNDLIAEHIQAVRDGSGPAFIECATYRWLEHVGPGDDHHEVYRDQTAYETAKATDPLETLGKSLADADRQAIDQKVEKELQSALQQAENAEFPEEKELFTHVYA